MSSKRCSVPATGWQASTAAPSRLRTARGLNCSPFGTKVRVTNVRSGRTVTVRINDRGPFVPGRVIDLSQAAAEELGIVGRGIAKVKLDVVQ